MTDARAIQAAVTRYTMEFPQADCPEVRDLVEAGALDQTRESTDPWGNDFLIECDERAIHVKSAGDDGQFGNDDDIGF